MTPPTPTGLLRGERVRLTALTKDDLPTIAGWREDAGFLRLFDAMPAVPKTEAQLAAWLDALHGASDGYVFAARPLAGDDLIGYVELEGILWAHGTGWVSIAIGDRARWGQGYGREAMTLLLAFAFDELNLHRVQLTVFNYNARAVSLYEKLGFTREGVFREFLQRDGQRYDMVLYGLLRSEWEQRS